MMDASIELEEVSLGLLKPAIIAVATSSGGFYARFTSSMLEFKKDRVWDHPEGIPNPVSCYS